MKTNILNLPFALIAACAIGACSGARETAVTTTGTAPVTGAEAVTENLNTPDKPTALTSAGSQITLDTLALNFPTDQNGQISAADFVAHAALAGKKEVELGRIAQQKGQSAEVRSFGAMMVTDHTKANAELQALATSKNISKMQPDSIPVDMDIAMASKQLNALSGEQFDRVYLTTMLNDHRKAIALHELGAKSSDAQVKAYAEKHLPSLRNHMAAVEKLQ
ncbi:DUF4142 domain-containing protein [Pedobacter deserti]|uniref:DUF4142 domain-containing protein n=1 Tax=Pedobacter deserti TaxID=2817382 RepID=UPI00210D0892|nr:DUF4142 domain-containing protein [Pedobacter sp. SYSU D00382]